MNLRSNHVALLVRSVHEAAILSIGVALFLGCSTARTVAGAQTNTPSTSWVYKGIEVTGNRSVDREAILALVPIKIGDEYREDYDSWKKTCESIKAAYGFHFTECAAVRYSNFDAYFTVEIVEKGYEHRNQFRKNPNKNIELADREVLTLYDNLYNRLWSLFSAGKPPNENADGGFLDFDDPEMHETVLKLIQLTPKYRENILQVLRYDHDAAKREKAANLLNWTIKRLDESIVFASRLLSDPASNVRNNISRFSLHFVSNLKRKADRRSVIDQLLLQLDRPTHGDRNKALYSLQNIVQKFPGESPYIRKKGAPLVEYLATNSILSNVKDPANELLQLVRSGSK